MTEVPYCTEYQGKYETFEAVCPHCGHRNVFNRASDLGDLRGISHKQVTCLAGPCGQPFIIGGDLVDPPHLLLLYDCGDLLERKQYAYCILNAAQSFELFFSLFLRVELGYKPFARESERPPISRLNALLEQLFGTVERYTYAPLRNIFLRLVLAGTRPGSLAAAASVVSSLPALRDQVPDADISVHAVSPVRDLLLQLNQSSVHRARNRVVHKDAYRPTREEAVAALREAESILGPLGVHLLLLTLDFNWHVKHA
jgi:hypothetical protein